MVRRITSLVLVVLALGLCIVSATSASAQYAPEDTGTPSSTTSTRPSSTSSSSSSSTSSSAPDSTMPEEELEIVELDDGDIDVLGEPPSRAMFTAPDPTLEPGESTEVDVPFSPPGEEPLPAGTEVFIYLEIIDGDPNTNAVLQGTAEVLADGSVRVNLTVPEGTPPGNYVFAIVHPGDEGRRPRVILTTIVVPSPTAEGASAEVPPLAPETVRKGAEAMTPAVREAIADVTRQISDAGADEVLAAVVGGGALAIDGARVLLDGEPILDERADGMNVPMIAIAAGAAAAGAIVLARRRTTIGAAR